MSVVSMQNPKNTTHAMIMTRPSSRKRAISVFIDNKQCSLVFSTKSSRYETILKPLLAIILLIACDSRMKNGRACMASKHQSGVTNVREISIIGKFTLVLSFIRSVILFINFVKWPLGTPCLFRWSNIFLV